MHAIAATRIKKSESKRWLQSAIAGVAYPSVRADRQHVIALENGGTPLNSGVVVALQSRVSDER